MKMYDYCMFFAMFGVIIGSIQGIMDYADTNNENPANQHLTNWYPNAQYPKQDDRAKAQLEEVTDTVDGDSNALQPTQNSMGEAGTFSMMSLCWKMFKSILYVPNMVGEVLKAPVTTLDPTTNEPVTSDLFAGFIAIVKLAMYLPYIMGFVQIILRFQTKYAE